MVMTVLMGFFQSLLDDVGYREVKKAGLDVYTSLELGEWEKAQEGWCSCAVLGGAAERRAT